MDFTEFLTLYQKTEVDFSLDFFLNGDLKLRQPAKGMRAGSDALFIGLYAGHNLSGKLLEIGCGSGAASATAAKLQKNLSVTGLEIQEFYADLARVNAKENHLSEQFKIITGNLTEITSVLSPDSFDGVISNPPFYDPAASRPPQDHGKRISFQENTDLVFWVRKCLYPLKNSGKAAFIFRTDRLAELFEAVKNRAGDILILPLQAKKNTPAKRVLFICKKGSRGATKILPSLVLHADNGEHTKEAQDILNGKLPLF